VKGIGGTGRDYGYCVAAGKNGKVYLTGRSLSFTSGISFDTITLNIPNTATDPMFIASYDSASRVLFAKVLDSGGDDNNAVAVSPSGCVYIGGDFIDSL